MLDFNLLFHLFVCRCFFGLFVVLEIVNANL